MEDTKTRKSGRMTLSSSELPHSSKKTLEWATGHGCEQRWRSSRNRGRETTKERQQDSVRLSNIPTQAKTGLEWATRPPATADLIVPTFTKERKGGPDPTVTRHATEARS
jgi:hypothetical protein